MVIALQLDQPHKVGTDLGALCTAHQCTSRQSLGTLQCSSALIQVFSPRTFLWRGRQERRVAHWEVHGERWRRQGRRADERMLFKNSMKNKKAEK
jgi:hypothetical protein